MKHARMFASLALAALFVTPLAGVATRAEAAVKRAPHGTAGASTKSAGYRQFTGTVLALDASSITVERGGRSAKQMVFARSAGMRSTGDVGKNARVTVYWRDESGKPVAHRVVVKEATNAGSN